MCVNIVKAIQLGLIFIIKKERNSLNMSKVMGEIF
jgi:hypothetical protein